MAFNEQNRIVIQYLCQSQNYSAKRFLKEFPDKGWKLGGLRYWVAVDRVQQEPTKTANR